MQMAPQVLHRVLYSTITPSAKQIEGLTIRPALLEGYTRHRVVDCDYPAIVPDSQPGACVRGTFVQGLKAQDLWRLDIFEGDQYERVFVKCRILQNETGGDGSDIATDEMVEAQTYEWIEGMHSLESREWDFDEFRTEKIKRWIGMEQFAGELRPSIREVDEAVEKAHRDPTAGRGLDGEITRKLNEDNAAADREELECAV